MVGNHTDHNRPRVKNIPQQLSRGCSHLYLPYELRRQTTAKLTRVVLAVASAAGLSSTKGQNKLLV
ncbi:hypothetical protein J6590_009299 [Homalodisca vitripennis]|nr:hypothetical protein J6590_009299 [Homalodisca vitripennis]